jgi:hypothetical protein
VKKIKVIKEEGELVTTTKVLHLSRNEFRYKGEIFKVLISEVRELGSQNKEFLEEANQEDVNSTLVRPEGTSDKIKAIKKEQGKLITVWLQ